MEPDSTAPLAVETCPACGAEVVSGGRYCPACGHELSRTVDEDVALADPLVGRVIADRYRILNLLGRGGMGVVYKVEHVHIGKLMAMKLLHGELARERGVQKRFRREAEAASQLNHPNTVQIFDFGNEGGLMYLVMEYVAGVDFGAVIQKEGTVDFARVCRLCLQVCASVGQAHARGIVHRDLKPENIMVVESKDGSEFAKVLDFGLAKLRDQEAHATLTQAGSIVGTPYYMAPEQIRGEDADHRVDVYALGAVMYKAIAGVPPFTAPTPVGVLTRHLSDEVVAPSLRMKTAQIPSAADQIILHAMHKKAADRFQSMEELQEALVAYLASVGEAEPSLSFRFPSGASFLGPSGSRRVIEVATRGDVDLYERRIKRRGWVGTASVIGIALAAVIALGWWGMRVGFPEPVADGLEHEPNERPEQALLLPRGTPFRGLLGQRQSPTKSDADVWKIENDRHSAEDRQAATFSLSAIPNMDVALDIVKAGIVVPELTVDHGGVGEGETAPNYPLVGSVYYLRVREVGVAGKMPTENVSDHYDLQWNYLDQVLSEEKALGNGVVMEREFNDSLERAELLSVGPAVSPVMVRGFLGWTGDVDTFCTTSPVKRLDAQVAGIPEVDLVLRWVDRERTESRKIDEGGVGEEERAALRLRRPKALCLEVSADRLEGKRASGADAYLLTVTAPDGSQ